MAYQRRVWGVVGRLPLQHGLGLVCSHAMEVPGWQPLVGDHFHHGEVGGRTQEGRDGAHLKVTMTVMMSQDKQGLYTINKFNN